MFDKSFYLINFFYIANIFIVYGLLGTLQNQILRPSELDLLWPVEWLGLIGVSHGAAVITAVSVVSAFLGIAYFELRWVRGLVFLSALQITALVNSAGAINHGYHEWVWLAFILFVFAPSKRREQAKMCRNTRFATILTIAYAQALILLFYTLSGFYKAFFASIMLLFGLTGGFSYNAMAIQLADRMTQTRTEPLLAPYIVEYPYFGWPLYTSLIFIELFAIAVLFRPVLHKIFGLTMIAFHFGTFFFMEIAFPLHVLWNGVLFLMSPFAPERSRPRDIILALPIIGTAIRHFDRGNLPLPKVESKPDPHSARH